MLECLCVVSTGSWLMQTKVFGPLSRLSQSRPLNGRHVVTALYLMGSGTDLALEISFRMADMEMGRHWNRGRVGMATLLQGHCGTTLILYRTPSWKQRLLVLWLDVALCGRGSGLSAVHLRSLAGVTVLQ